ncbi:hypothetical protein ACSQ67_013541 [Phaseolus vulgaris]
MLRKIRGMDNVDEEFQALVDAIEATKDVEHPWKNITQPKYRPQLTFCSLIPFFQQFTGINVIMFYALSYLKLWVLVTILPLCLLSSLEVLTWLPLLFPFSLWTSLGEGYCSSKVAFKCLFVGLFVGIMIALKFGVSGEGHFSSGEVRYSLIFYMCIRCKDMHGHGVH